MAEKKSIVETNMDKISHAIEDAQVRPKNPTPLDISVFG